MARSSEPRSWSRVSDASWLYPFKGIVYFLTNPFLWPLLRGRLLPCAILSFIVTSSLFIWAYLPQVAFLAIFHGVHLAFVNGAFLVLGESAAIVALLFEIFFVDECLVSIFDAVLIKHGYEDLVASCRLINTNGNTPTKRLGEPTTSAVYSPFSLRQIVEFVLFLPLNFVPLIGTPIFLILTGYRAGPLHHWRYFKLLGLSKHERRETIRKRRLRYTWFGTIALLLQLLPPLSMLFLMTTAAGSALWVARLEQNRRYSATEADADLSQPPYADEPV